MKCVTPLIIDTKVPRWVDGELTQKVPVPCGKCYACANKRVNDWVYRLEWERRRSFSSYFITLTYNNENVPISKNGYMTCKIDHVQKFLKRLRKHEPDSNIKYYAASEYGSRTYRPHYHLIIFGVENIDNIRKAWTKKGKPIGAVHKGTVTSRSIAYTLKYIQKPSRIPIHKRDDRQKERSLMSKGLGDNYLSEPMKKYHKKNLGSVIIVEREYKMMLPRYYMDKIYDDEEKAAISKKLDDHYKNEKIKKEKRIHKLYNGKMSLEEYEELEHQSRIYKQLKIDLNEKI